MIHGAWHGSWCWKRVRDLLTAEGHRIFTPTLTGLGERCHLLSRDVGLDTHIMDVVNLLIWEDLRDIVLIGHSYGGTVVRHVVDRLPDRVRSLVYLDASIPEDGKSTADYLPDGGKRYREQALAHGDGWKVPPDPASVFAVNAADAAWVDRQCTPHPLSSLEAAARLSGACGGLGDNRYILARGRSLRADTTRCSTCRETSLHCCCSGRNVPETAIGVTGVADETNLQGWGAKLMFEIGFQRRPMSN